jgi:hypothetical protein
MEDPTLVVAFLVIVSLALFGGLLLGRSINKRRFRKLTEGNERTSGDGTVNVGHIGEFFCLKCNLVLDSAVATPTIKQLGRYKVLCPAGHAAAKVKEMTFRVGLLHVALSMIAIGFCVGIVVLVLSDFSKSQTARVVGGAVGILILGLLVFTALQGIKYSRQGYPNSQYGRYCYGVALGWIGTFVGLGCIDIAIR